MVWEPDAIGGQSGSGVWSDDNGHQFGLLTWQWGSHGAGQQTAEIYRQSKDATTKGHIKPPGLKELDDRFDTHDLDMGNDDPICEPGFYSIAGIADYPIWAEDQTKPEPEPDAPGEPSLSLSIRDWAKYQSELEAFHAKWAAIGSDAPAKPAEPDEDDTTDSPGFGL